MCNYEPPFQMTDKIISLVADISEQIGKISVLAHGMLNPHLRRSNRIKTIHSSLAIEHNSLSLEQVTAILNGKRILGNPHEIQEVTNAYDAYELMLSLNPLSVDDLLLAHKFMMRGLIEENGRFRSGGVGIFEGEKLVHMAPPAQFVPGFIHQLLHWYENSTMHPLVKSAVVHYEFEFIHPFSDGNGRMGRMWHSMLLGQWKELFYWLPIEELIRSRQQEYYQVLGVADRKANSAAFVELLLQIIYDTLQEINVVGIQSAKSDALNGALHDVLDLEARKLLILIEQNPSANQMEFAELMHVSRRKVQRLMADLQAEQLITRVGGKRNGVWKIIK